MPGKVTVLNTIGIILQYSIVVLLYYFLFQVSRAIYKDLMREWPDGAALFAPAAGAAQKEEQARLVAVETGPVRLEHPVYVLGESISIGRGENNGIVIADNFASHEHACITRYRHGFWLSDLGSTNGTYVNNHRVTDEVALNSGDLVRIGAVTFRFER